MELGFLVPLQAPALEQLATTSWWQERSQHSSSVLPNPKERDNLSRKPGISSMFGPGALHNTSLAIVGGPLVLTLSDTNVEGVSRRTFVTKAGARDKWLVLSVSRRCWVVEGPPLTGQSQMPPLYPPC